MSSDYICGTDLAGVSDLNVCGCDSAQAYTYLHVGYVKWRSIRKHYCYVTQKGFLEFCV